MSKAKLIIAAALVILILLLIFQNLDPCGIRFLFWSGSLPRALMLFIALVIGCAIGFLLATMTRKNP
jgi:uncharacterized integral membrane protein